MQLGSLQTFSLPATIRHAISFTREIGIRYLWVDSLCIVQDDNEHKGKQIKHMHQVFGGALVTIVAASGDDADAGLPGVPDAPRNVEQPIASVDGLRLLPRVGFLDVTLSVSYNKVRKGQLRTLRVGINADPPDA